MVLHCRSEGEREREKSGGRGICGGGRVQCVIVSSSGCLFEVWGRVFIPSDLIWTRPHVQSSFEPQLQLSRIIFSPSLSLYTIMVLLLNDGDNSIFVSSISRVVCADLSSGPS